MPWMLPAAAIAAPIIGGLIGQGAANSQAAAANAARQQALAAFANINTPSVQDQLLNLQTTGLQGTYNPLTQNAVNLGPSQMAGISTDPRLQQAQMSALQQLSGLSQTGLSPADLAAMEQSRRASAENAQAQQQAVLQNMQQRGQGGSGAELIARLKAAQSGSDAASQAGMQTVQQAQARALQALSQQGSLAGQIQGQQFGEQADIARAKDIIGQYNAQNAQNVQAQNVQAQNQGQLRNLSEAQRLAEQQAAIKNYQQEHNVGLQQQNFQNQMQKASGLSGQYGNIANQAQQNAANQSSMWSGMGQGVGQLAAGIYNTNNKSAQKVPNQTQVAGDNGTDYSGNV